jgi:hypothetical protein
VFAEALTKALSQLDAARAQGLLTAYALIGGFAVAAWGVPRATQDIDFAVAIGTNDPQTLASFMGGRYHGGGPDDPLKGVIRATVTVASASIPLQLVFLPSTFTDAIFQQIKALSIMNQSVPVVNWDMLVLLKIYAGGPQDVLDARQILKLRQTSANDLSRVSDLADRLGIGDEWMAFLLAHAKDQ